MAKTKTSKKKEPKAKGEEKKQAKKVKAKEDTSSSKPAKSLYEKELDHYRMFLEHGFDTAYNYYGFSLFHSLSPEEKVEIFKKLGFEPKTPEDFYNLGCLSARDEDYQTARKFFEKTIDMAADFEEAYYNLALTLEKLGKDKAAIENWELYSEFLDDDSSEALLISQHLEELKGTKSIAKTKSSRKK